MQLVDKNLAQWQSQFVTSLLAEPYQGLSDLPAQFQIYRNNVMVSLINALIGVYPRIDQMIGRDNFIVLARGFVRGFPPKRPQLVEFGAEFPTYIGTQSYAIADFPDIQQLAAIEWACHESYFAGDMQKLLLDDITTIASDNIERLILHRAARLIGHCPHSLTQLLGLPESDGLGLVVVRNDNEVYLLSLDLTLYKFLQFLDESKNVIMALNMLMDDTIDPVKILQSAVQAGTIGING